MVDPEAPAATQPVYSIGAVARMIGVPASTIRSWEERYELVVPQRSPGGQRLYSRDQVEQLRFIEDQIERGLQAGDAHRILEQRMTTGRPLLADSVPSGEPRLLVLLAERDPYAAEFAEFFLRTEGYDIATTLTKADAVEFLDAHRPNLVVVELLMSGRAGTELVGLARERGCHVLAISPLDLKDDALAAGAEAFLRKPYQPLHLVSIVRDLLGTSALVRRPEQQA